MPSCHSTLTNPRPQRRIYTHSSYTAPNHHQTLLHTGFGGGYCGCMCRCRSRSWNLGKSHLHVSLFYTRPTSRFLQLSLFSHPVSMYLLGHGNTHHVWDRHVLNEGHMWVMVPREILSIRLIGQQELFFVVIVRLSLHSCISHCLSPS